MDLAWERGCKVHVYLTPIQIKQLLPNLLKILIWSSGSLHNVHVCERGSRDHAWKRGPKIYERLTLNFQVYPM